MSNYEHLGMYVLQFKSFIFILSICQTPNITTQFHRNIENIKTVLIMLLELVG